MIQKRTDFFIQKRHRIMAAVDASCRQHKRKSKQDQLTEQEDFFLSGEGETGWYIKKSKSVVESMLQSYATCMHWRTINRNLFYGSKSIRKSSLVTDR